MNTEGIGGGAVLKGSGENIIPCIIPCVVYQHGCGPPLYRLSLVLLKWQKFNIQVSHMISCFLYHPRSLVGFIIIIVLLIALQIWIGLRHADCLDLYDDVD